jgi:hypothetical protein
MGYLPSERDRCPYCLVVVVFEDPIGSIGTVNNQIRIPAQIPLKSPVTITISRLEMSFCPNCKKPIIGLRESPEKWTMIWPRFFQRPPAPDEVPKAIREDYQEAAEVLSISAKASAALSRRCLQAALDLAGQLDGVRNVGNFAAHPQKGVNSAEILDVEPGEAEWNLDVLDLLFDFGFVKPTIANRRVAELNEKLKAAGKPEMKQPVKKEPSQSP